MHDLAATHFEGYRLFRVNVNRLELRSLAYDQEIWYPHEPKQSKCRVSRGHDIHEPSEKCTCGIHAVHSRREIRLAYPGLAQNVMFSHERTRGLLFDSYDKTSFVSARVMLWGVVVEHQRGYRAEWAELMPETIRWWPRLGFKHNQKLLEAIQRRYGG